MKTTFLVLAGLLAAVTVAFGQRSSASYQLVAESFDSGGLLQSTSYTVGASLVPISGIASSTTYTLLGGFSPVSISAEEIEAPAITAHPESLALFTGQSATFSVEATGGALSFQWRKDGDDIEGATTATYSISAVTLEDAGDYTVLVSNPEGEVESDPATLTVEDIADFATVLFIDFEDGVNPLSAGTVTSERSFSGQNSLFLDAGVAAVLDMPGSLHKQHVRINMKLFDQGKFIDRSNPGYHANVYGPRWGVSTGNHVGDEGGPQPSVGVTITERAFLSSAGGYGVQGTGSANTGQSRYAASWFTVSFFTGSAAIRADAPWLGDGGSIENDTWQLPQPGDGTWLDVTFDVAADGETVITMFDPVRETEAVLTGRNITDAVTQLWLWGGRNHATAGLALAGLWIDDIDIQGPLGAGEVELPVIVQQPEAQSVAVGSTATLSVEATGENLAYQWFHRLDSRVPRLAIEGATDAELVIEEVAMGDRGLYMVQVTNPGGLVESDEVQLTVVTEPAITSAPQEQLVAEGDTATFSVSATGGDLSYQWRFRTDPRLAAQPIEGATESQLVIEDVTTDDAGRYSVVVSNAAGSVTSADALLRVATLPVITSQPESVAVRARNDATFSVTATGEALTYQWRYRDDPRLPAQDIDGATDPVLVISSALSGDAGRYSVRVSNPAGSVVSVDARLFVTNAPSALGSATDLGDGIWMSSWFGLFFVQGSWINSADHGWIYHWPGQPLGRMWVWDMGIAEHADAPGYVYIAEETYPYIYISGLGWGYFLAEASDAEKRFIYIFSLGEWVEFGLVKGPLQWD